MSTLSVPLTPELEVALNRMVKKGYAETKAALARRAIQYFDEGQAVAEVLEAEQEIRDGKIMFGDLDQLVKKLRV